jgi:3-methylfumaryl-CoA hydratase
MSEDASDWIGRSRSQDDVIGLERAFALWASLDTGDPKPQAGASLPPLWHWLYFWEINERSDLGPDGHPRLGGFMPALGHVRRMWAGSQVVFHTPLRIGEAATRTSTITSVERRQGRTGGLTFVTVRHQITSPSGLAVTDDQDIVYRDPPPPGTTPASRSGETAPDGGDRAENWAADPVLLFRYSALTFNGHRIHYDADFVRDTEGYPGLVVHGPLIATLMAGIATRHRPAAALASFAFRAVSPIFAEQPFSVHLAGQGDAANVWVRTHAGMFAARGEVRWQA